MASRRFEQVPLEGPERAAYVWLEQLIVAEVARTNALLEAGSAARSSGGALLVTGLRLLRTAFTDLEPKAGQAKISRRLAAIDGTDARPGEGVLLDDAPS